MFLGLKWILLQTSSSDFAAAGSDPRNGCRVGPAQQAEIVWESANLTP
jgi:hypothetical protein